MVSSCDDHGEGDVDGDGDDHGDDHGEGDIGEVSDHLPPPSSQLLIELRPSSGFDWAQRW